MSTHVPPERLDDYLCGRLDADDCESIEQHLDACPACAQLTAELQPQDAMLDLLKQASSLGVSTTSVGVSSKANETSQPANLLDSVPDTSSSTRSSVGETPIATPEVRIFLDKPIDAHQLDSQWQSLATESFKNSGLHELWDGEVELKDHPRYEILQPLGRGGMGVVWLARHKTMERLVALKIVRRSERGHDRLVSWFRNEARVISRLKHPNIVAAYDAEDSGKHHFIVFEYIDGETLSQIARGKPLEERDALGTIRTVATALSYAHAQGLVHRDIKPGNLIRDRQGVIKILDFGIASELEDVVDSDQPHIPVGTRAYLAPECFRSAPPSSATDIYALGCTLYYLLVGKPAVAAIDATATIDIHRSGPDTAGSDVTSHTQVDTLSHLSDDPALAHLSQATQQLIYRMTARNADHRPASADEVIASIERILSGTDFTSDIDQTASQSKQQVNRSRRMVLGAMGSAAMLSTAALIGRRWFVPSEPVQPDPSQQRLSRKLFQAACPNFATNLDRFESGTEELLLTPSKLGDGVENDFECSEKDLDIHVFEPNRQVWLNYEFIRGRHLCLFMRVRVQRFQTGFANFKAAFLDHQGKECNFQWVNDGHDQRLLMEIVTDGRLTPVWRKDLDSDTAFVGDIAMHLNGKSLEVYLDDQLLTAQNCEESSARFPAIAANSSDVSVCALARLITS